MKQIAYNHINPYTIKRHVEKALGEVYYLTFLRVYWDWCNVIPLNSIADMVRFSNNAIMEHMITSP